MVRAVRIPVTVKMRKGWDENQVNAADVARSVEDAGASAIAIHGRTASQGYSGQADWGFVGRVACTVRIPVFGSGDCVEPRQIVERLQQDASGVYVGRGVLRNPWILAQARDLLAGREACEITPEARGRFLLEYIALLRDERVREPEGFRHVAPGATSIHAQAPADAPVTRHDRWIINKLRALCAWYSRGLEGGASLRAAVNGATSLVELRAVIEDFFFGVPALVRAHA
jgi:tRNA-dihydrouridine synthase